MANADVPRRRRGREATAAAILSAAEQLFAKRGYNAVTVRDIAHRAGVSHALVHQYIGTKADVFRSVLARNEGLILAAAPDNTDVLESVALMARQALTLTGRAAFGVGPRLTRVERLPIREGREAIRLHFT